jgi:hypothetical protein
LNLTAWGKGEVTVKVQAPRNTTVGESYVVGLTEWVQNSAVGHVTLVTRVARRLP